MSEEITVEKKKSYLKWLTRNYQFRVRESLWILDYLYNHESMLEKTHFVERVEESPRGIYLSDSTSPAQDFLFYKKGHSYEDPVQAFHEVRLNWSSDLYIEIDFKDSWQSKEYLSVLEDNPYAPWNEDLSDDVFYEMKEALRYETMVQNEKELIKKIDEALRVEDKKQFDQLSKQLKAVKQLKNEFILKD